MVRHLLMLVCSNGRNVLYLTPTHSNGGIHWYVTVQSLGGLTQVLPTTDVPRLSGTHHTTATPVPDLAHPIVTVQHTQRTITRPSALLLSLDKLTGNMFHFFLFHMVLKQIIYWIKFDILTMILWFSILFRYELIINDFFLFHKSGSALKLPVPWFNDAARFHWQAVWLNGRCRTLWSGESLNTFHTIHNGCELRSL